MSPGQERPLQAAPPRVEALRYRFDLLVGGLLLVMIFGGCIALRLVQQAEGMSLEGVARASQLQLVLVFIGLLALLGLALLMRCLVTMPLQHMAEGIGAMQRTGRLIKLPVVGANELRAFAVNFNRLVEHVEEQKRRMREHVVELQNANTELSHLAGLKDDFLSTISHQFRTPLTSMVEGLRLIRDGTLGPITTDLDGMVGMLHDNAKRLDHLIEEALDLSLIKSGHRLLDRKPDNLAEMLRRSQALWQATAESRTIRLVCGELPSVYMDAEAIREVMDHLLRNALRHAPPRSEITIEAQARATVVEVSVQDQGPGMSEAQLAKLFQPFIHVQTPDAPGSEGGGLGLAICRQVLERHRGRIDAHAKERQGMTVAFELPIASPRFLLEEAFRCVREDAEQEEGQFGLLLVTPQESADLTSTELMQRTEVALRRNTHRGDRFIRLDDRTLVIFAVTDLAGLSAMVRRLETVLQEAALHVMVARALFPFEGNAPDLLIETARRRLGSGAQERAAAAAPERRSEHVSTTQEHDGHG